MKKERVRIRVQAHARTFPTWAYLERTLIDTMNESIDLVLEKYLKPDGEFLWPPHPEKVKGGIGSLDDVYESFHSWPLFYALGGDKRFLELAYKEYDVTTRQMARFPQGDHSSVEKEFWPYGDWMHIGEGSQLFYYLNLADPENPKNRERSLRFAGFYLNEDESIAEKNYDEAHHVMRSTATGALGALFSAKNSSMGHASYMDFYGIPFYDLPGIQTVYDLEDPDNARRMGEAMRTRQQRSDSPTNLLSTSLMVNAYLHTGEEKYRKWVLEYAQAWRERTEKNGGLIPDNCGPSGEPGELIDGKWFGGYYGWTFPHGFMFIAEGVATAAENECLLTGDTERLGWIREQTAQVVSHGREIDGSFYVPFKYAEDGSVIEYSVCNDNIVTRPDKVTSREDFSRKKQVDGGWFEFQLLLPQPMTHAYFHTFSEQDLALLRKTRDAINRGHERIDPSCMEILGGPANGYRYYPGVLKYMGGQDRALLGYHEGIFPDYPEAILRHNLEQVYRRLKEMREDEQSPDDYGDDYLQLRNPITTEGLVHLTLGGPMALYNGGLLQVSLFYFDPARKRPGLPGSVSALVSRVAKDGLTLTLANLHPMDKRVVTVQGGAFAEHTFTRVTAADYEGQTQSFEVDDTHFDVELEPGSLVTLEVGMKRYANRPTYHTGALEA